MKYLIGVILIGTFMSAHGNPTQSTHGNPNQDDRNLNMRLIGLSSCIKWEMRREER
jgi:hypothetical protein